MASRRNRRTADDRVANVVAYAATAGEKKAAEAFGVHRATVSRYAKIVDESPPDSEMRRIVRQKRQEYYDSISVELARALELAIQRCAELLPQEADLYKAVGAAKVLGELSHNGRVLDVEIRDLEAESDQEAAPGEDNVRALKRSAS